VNSRFINILRSFSYALSSNLISLLVSILVIIIVPKLIGVEEYGYWQLYLFYASYVGFMHFGWNDGIYLRYGGEVYGKLNKELFFSQFHMLSFMQVALGILISIATLVFINDQDRKFILLMVALCMIITNVRWMLIYVLQATNRIKEYAQITIIGRILYILIIVALLVSGFRDYKLMIIADIIGRLISFAYAIYICKDIVFRKASTFYFSFKETIENISVGIKLMFATIASMLIIGVVRFGIERFWDISVFGKVSLTLSASNLLMLFINAVGIIIFPILKRTQSKNLAGIYITMRDFLMLILLGLLIIYYPVKELLSIWLPKYADSLTYMALLFPICIFEGKMALLINTYLKTLRKEALMLKINLISLGVSIISTLLLAALIHDLNLLIVSIVFLLGFRCILAEILLTRHINISVLKDIALEITMTVAFVLTGWFIDSGWTVMLYGSAYILYILIKRKDIFTAIGKIRTLMKS